MRLRGVLLDAAGTLIELREPVGESYARIAREFGVDVPGWRLEEAFGRVLRGAPVMAFPGEPPERIRALERAWWRDVVRSTFRAADQMLRFADFEGCFEALFAHFARPEAWRARPDAGAALAALEAEGRRVAVLSNFDHRLPAILAGLGLATGPVLLPGELGAAKPDPRCFGRALERLGLAAAESVYVGDGPASHLEAARRAGLRAIDVASLATLGELPHRIAGLEREDSSP